MIISIDGPAGAGKSTVARRLARALGMGYLDTGAMYRALAHVALEEGVAPDDADGLATLARERPVHLRQTSDGSQVTIGGEDVTEAIREPRISRVVSEVSSHRGVRDIMIDAQRRTLSAGDWVAEGRDVGSNVAPHADVKVFLTASDDERARRRRADLAGRGIRQAEGDVLSELRRRDELDCGRDADPLLVPDEAVVIDSSRMVVDDVVARIAEVVQATRTGSDG